jgi:hypothetical protein
LRLLPRHCRSDIAIGRGHAIEVCEHLSILLAAKTRALRRPHRESANVTDTPPVNWKSASRPPQNEDDEGDNEDRSKYSTADVHVNLLEKVLR